MTLQSVDLRMRPIRACAGGRVVASPHARKLAADGWNEHSAGLRQWVARVHHCRGRPAAH